MRSLPPTLSEPRSASVPIPIPVPGVLRRRIALASVFILTVLSFQAAAQEPTPLPRTPGTPPPAQSDAIRPLGPSLFPIYDHHLRTRDDTEVKTIFFFLYQSTLRRGTGDRSLLLLPFFYWQRFAAPEDRRFYLFPFLFFRRAGEEESFTYSAPLFWSRDTPEKAYRLLFPLWWRSLDKKSQLTEDRFLFPLLKLTRQAASEKTEAESRFRFGLRRLLELFEVRSGAATKGFTFLNFFNWKEETEGGLAPVRHEWTRASDGTEEGRTIVFPLFWRGTTPVSQYLIGGPFYGYHSGGDRATQYFTPLVWQTEGKGGLKSFFFFPFYDRQTSQDPQLSYLAANPLFFRREEEKARSWGLLRLLPISSRGFDFFSLYSRTTETAPDRTTQWFLGGVGHSAIQRDGIQGRRWLLPAYLDAFNERWRFRTLFPILWNYQARSGAEATWSFTYGMPTYFAWGAPRDSFATGFPIYWASQSGARSWSFLFPFFLSQKDSSTSAFYSIPFSRVSFFALKAFSLLAGGVTHRSHSDAKGQPDGWSLDLLWWLWGFEKRPDQGQFRLLPLFWKARQGEDHSLFVAPFLYRQWGPTHRQNYFFPVYGRFRSSDGRLRRDFYAAGLFGRTEEDDSAGALMRWRNDFFWSLASFQKNQQLSLAHRRFLPLGFWQTESRGGARTILGPLLYSHRIDSGRTTHRLKLLLGNLYFSETLEEEIPPTAAPVASAPAVSAPSPSDSAAQSDAPTPALLTPAGPAPSNPAAAASVAPEKPTAATAPPLARRVVSKSKGILWPITRWGWNAQGNPAEWALPFYFHSTTPTMETRTIFPFLYSRRESASYRAGYFRYFFLFDWEKFEGGYRFSIGQLIADWLIDRLKDEKRFRFLYPIFQFQFAPEGASFQVTPLFQGKRWEAGGERTRSLFLFPVLFRGATEMKNPDGSYTQNSRHFYVFPFYGVSQRSLRTDRDFLMPFLHLQTTPDGFSFQFLPSFYIRSGPGESSVRLWPLHTHESGEGAGDSWISRYLYFSKLAKRQQSFNYRLDPFVAWYRSSPEETRAGALFALVRYLRTTKEEGTDVSWWALPLARGYSRPTESGNWLFPLHFARDSGVRPIDDAQPARFLFLVNRLRGAGIRHFSVLWKLLEFSHSPERPEYREFRVLHALVVNRRTESSREMAFNPIFNYSRDDAAKRLRWSMLFELYRFERVEGIPRHRLFWLFSF